MLLVFGQSTRLSFSEYRFPFWFGLVQCAASLIHTTQQMYDDVFDSGVRLRFAAPCSLLLGHCFSFLLFSPPCSLFLTPCSSLLLGIASYGGGRVPSVLPVYPLPRRCLRIDAPSVIRLRPRLVRFSRVSVTCDIALGCAPYLLSSLSVAVPL